MAGDACFGPEILPEKPACMFPQARYIRKRIMLFDIQEIQQHP